MVEPPSFSYGRHGSQQVYADCWATCDLSIGLPFFFVWNNPNGNLRQSPRAK